MAVLRHESISWRWNDLRGAVWFGVFNGMDYALIFWAEQYIPSGLTAIINAALPFSSLVFACLLAGEKFTASKAAGLAVILAGVWIVNRPPLFLRAGKGCPVEERL